MGHWRVIPKREENERQRPTPCSTLAFDQGGVILGFSYLFIEISTIICDIKTKKNGCFVWCSDWYVLNMNWDVVIICTENWITEWKVYTVVYYNVLYICIYQSLPSIYNVISQGLNSKLQPANKKTYRFDFVDSHLFTKMSKFNWTSNWLQKRQYILLPGTRTCTRLETIFCTFTYYINQCKPMYINISII